ncbi:hypothetical protein [Prevotella sp.]|uniref:hypothetical protein n=1 Tax=Prevotella sp. TaxID=59823 RepID=UPI003F7E2141
MENTLKNIDYKIEKRNTNEYILTYHSRYYQVGQLVYDILRIGRECQNLESLKKQLGRNDISLYEIHDIITLKIMPLFKKEDNPEDLTYTKASKAYWLNKRFLKGSQIVKIVDLLSLLFGRTFYPILVLATIVNVVAYSYVPLRDTHFTWSENAITIIILYALCFLIFFLHETGHEAAAQKAGLPVRDINFSMYYIFPVFYVNLDDAWRKNLSERIKINLGGVYMQALVNLIILALMYVVHNPLAFNVLLYLYWTNTATLLFNFIPFFKFDGYWILSDLLKVPNLIDASNEWYMSFVVKKSPFAEGHSLQLPTAKKTIFVVFCVLRAAFISLGILCLLACTIYMVMHTVYMIQNASYMQVDRSMIADIMLDVLYILVICYAVLRFLKNGLIALRGYIKR